MKRNQFFNILKVQHFKDTFPKLEPWRSYNTWKLCDFALKNGLQIARRRCPDDVLLWTRLRDCNTIRCVLAFVLTIHNNILVVIWRFRESIQFRIIRNVVLLQKPFLVIDSVHNTTWHGWNWTINSSQSADKNWAVFNAKKKTKFLFGRT